MLSRWFVFALSTLAIAQPQKITLPGREVSVPMLDIGGRPMVDLTIDGKGPYKFIVDTGAHETAIDSGLAGELGLRERAPVREIRVGGALLQGMEVEQAPLALMFPGPDAPQGVLSAASFPGFLLILDYPAKRIVIRAGSLPAADHRTIFEYAADKPLPMVAIRVAGVETAVDLDSGSPLGLTLPVKFLKQLSLASEPKDIGRARTPGGEFPISSARVNGAIELGQYRLDLAQVRFSDVAPGPEPPNGNIGAEVLRDFKVTFDSKNRRIRIEK